MEQRPLDDEIFALENGHVENLQALPLFTDDTVFHGLDGNKIDEGSPYLHLDTRRTSAGMEMSFLVCWPMGTRLLIRTHPVLEYFSWWLDPVFSMLVEHEQAA